MTDAGRMTGAFERFRDGFGGPLLTDGGAEYEVARPLFNSMIEKRPAVIAQCATAEQVAEALRFGREQGLEIAVRAGGHSVAGMSLCDGGLVIDVRPMKRLEVDPERRIARVGAGCTWGELDRATQEHGLAVTGGRDSGTGVAGFTLGGGSGWLERKHGLACDNLLAVDLVTADGRRITASRDEHPDLFWALRGGGGNFGVATSFTFQLHPVGPEVLAGVLVYEPEQGEALQRLMRDLVPEAPEELGPGIAYATAPADEAFPAHLHDRLVAMAIVCYAGAVEAGEEVVAPLRALGPAADLVEPMPYAEFQCMFDVPPGYRNWWTAEYLHSVTDEAVAVIHDHSTRLPAPSMAQSLIFPWGGAVARRADEETPMTDRDAAWAVHPFSMWKEPAEDEQYIGWARDFREDVRRFSSGGVYLNFVGDEGEDRVRAAFGEAKYRRLAVIKAQYDPDNVFRGNQNIRPAAQ